MAAFQLMVGTAIRGYHVYRDVWTPEVHEEFACRQESDNEHDRFAIAIFTDGENVLGHLPREISRVSFYFLEHDGSITGKVTSKRRFCRQRGGMEIPCEITFTGKKKHIEKLKYFLEMHNFSCIEYVL